MAHLPARPRTAASSWTKSASRILDVAEELVQRQGFSDVSYADIAAELGVTKASLHYHFPTKESLGDALVARYSSRFFAELDALGLGDPGARLRGYVALYRGVLQADRMCLCGILASSARTLPPGMRAAVGEFFERNQAWLEDAIREAHPDATTSPESVRDAARLTIDALEGTMMMALALDEPERFDRVAERLLAQLSAACP